MLGTGQFIVLSTYLPNFENNSLKILYLSWRYPINFTNNNEIVMEVIQVHKPELFPLRCLTFNTPKIGEFLPSLKNDGTWNYYGISLNIKKDIPVPLYIEFHERHRSSYGSNFGSIVRQAFTTKRELYSRYVKNSSTWYIPTFCCAGMPWAQQDPIFLGLL